VQQQSQRFPAYQIFEKIPVILNFHICKFMLGYNQQSLNNLSSLKVLYINNAAFVILALIHINNAGQEK
jgi:hypothetical protein